MGLAGGYYSSQVLQSNFTVLSPVNGLVNVWRLQNPYYYFFCLKMCTAIDIQQTAIATKMIAYSIAQLRTIWLTAIAVQLTATISANAFSIVILFLICLVNTFIFVHLSKVPKHFGK